jgi:protein-S-isoprenylcysteine O-methyltransferase Ste14
VGAVFVRLTLGAATTFRIVPGEGAPRRSELVSLVFSNDTPALLWTGGPFAYVRNPFYASYLLAMASVALMLPSPFRFLLFAGTTTLLTSAARHEERKFASSPLALEYESYRRRTGRFFPRLQAARGDRRP